MQQSILVLGLGNLIQSDDGLGVRALHRLESDSRLPAGVNLVDGGTHGLALLPAVCDCDRLLVLDAVDTAAPPGTVVRLDARDLAGLRGAAAIHQLGLVDLLNSVRLLGREPAEVVLFGMQPATVELGTCLSPPVEACLDELVDAVLAQLQQWVDCASLRPTKTSEDHLGTARFSKR